MFKSKNKCFIRRQCTKKVQLIARKSLGFKLATDLKANASEKKKQYESYIKIKGQ